MCLTRHRDYPAEPGSIGAARDFVAALVVALLDPRGWTVADDAALLVSELVTSAVEARCSHVDVQAAVHADHLDLLVTGRGPSKVAEPPGGPPPPAASTLLRARLLDGLGGDARLHREPDGTLVGAARLPCRSDWTAGVPCNDPAADPL